MLELSSHHPGQQQPKSLEMALPAGSVPVWQLDHAEIDRKLGYFGQARFVGIYYERRGEEVMWGDGWSTGFGTGAWMYFLEEIAPLVALYEVNVGDNDVEGLEVLVLDRLERLAYFVDRETASHFLVEQYESPEKR
ncbi:MAG: hypothetical protein ACM359_15775 [Bacillota bacterium]